MKPKYQFHDLDKIMEIMHQLQRDAMSEGKEGQARDWEQVISQVFLANADNETGGIINATNENSTCEI